MRTIQLSGIAFALSLVSVPHAFAVTGGNYSTYNVMVNKGLFGCTCGTSTKNCSGLLSKEKLNKAWIEDHENLFPDILVNKKFVNPLDDSVMKTDKVLTLPTKSGQVTDPVDMAKTSATTLNSTPVEMGSTVMNTKTAMNTKTMSSGSFSAGMNMHGAGMNMNGPGGPGAEGMGGFNMNSGAGGAAMIKVSNSNTAMNKVQAIKNPYSLLSVGNCGGSSSKQPAPTTATSSTNDPSGGGGSITPASPIIDPPKEVASECPDGAGDCGECTDPVSCGGPTPFSSIQAATLVKSNEILKTADKGNEAAKKLMDKVPELAKELSKTPSAVARSGGNGSSGSGTGLSSGDTGSSGSGKSEGGKEEKLDTDTGSAYTASGGGGSGSLGGNANSATSEGGFNTSGEIAFGNSAAPSDGEGSGAGRDPASASDDGRRSNGGAGGGAGGRIEDDSWKQDGMGARRERALGMDPDSYFSMIGMGEDLFKRVHTRYEKVDQDHGVTE